MTQVPVAEPPPPKEKFLSDDIFKKKAPPKKKAKEPLPAIVPKIAPVKKKRVMSEKQLEALARGRANRAKKKAPPSPQQQREEAKTEAPTSQPAPAPAPAPAPVAQKQMYSKEDLQEMVFQGVQKYDLQRKQRKKKKQAAEASEVHEKKVFSQINSALNRQNDPWANCFT